MKKILLFCFIICSAVSCSPEEDPSLEFYYETLPVESVDIPTEFVYGYTYEIRMTYIRPTGCHVFNDFYYLSEGSQRTIAIITTVFNDLDCDTSESEEEVPFNFQVNSHEPYVFKFWQGEDENGIDTYHIVEVPVVE